MSARSLLWRPRLLIILCLTTFDHCSPPILLPLPHWTCQSSHISECSHMPLRLPPLCTLLAAHDLSIFRWNVIFSKYQLWALNLPYMFPCYAELPLLRIIKLMITCLMSVFSTGLHENKDLHESTDSQELECSGHVFIDWSKILENTVPLWHFENGRTVARYCWCWCPAVSRTTQPRGRNVSIHLLWRFTVCPSLCNSLYIYFI